MKLNSVTGGLLKWYDENKRDLPWRQTRDPYKIWLSEIILQQTRVSQGLPYYQRFIRKYPTVADLASAGDTEVLRIWQGLGYYSRVRNMLRCARTIVSDYGGKFPEEPNQLKRLPGIGTYTAAAIASIAFDRAVPVVDGNVYRVLSRICGIYENPQSASGKRIFTEEAGKYLTDTIPGDFNQAIMEFGALHCIPVNPACSRCPLVENCYAYKNSEVGSLPVKNVRPATKKRYFLYFIIREGSRIFLNERKSEDIWKGLYDFYLIETFTAAITTDKITKFLMSGRGISENGNPDKITKRQLTHQTIHARFVQIDAVDITPEFRAILDERGKFYRQKEIGDLPKPVLIENYLKEEIF